VTATLADTTIAPVGEDLPPPDPAGWHLRAAALIVDVVPAVTVVATMAVVAWALPQRSAWWWVGVAVGAAATALSGGNRVLLPAVTGWSLGRALFGLAVVRPDGSAVGPGRLLLRELAHLLDTLAVFVGWLWPLWDSRRRTFADLLLRTEVHRLEPDRRPQRIRRLTAAVWSGAALLCVAGAVLSIFLVYRPDRASERTRSELQAEGPRIVTRILSYAPQTLRDDFTRALSLTTANYRPKLAEQQESVQKRQPVVNEYLPADSAVLSAQPDRGKMLLFLQGRRGDGNQERLISATVRVTFVKGPGGRWLVDDLDVVTKPKPPKGEK
jgi:Mce-associated membrane protein